MPYQEKTEFLSYNTAIFMSIGLFVCPQLSWNLVPTYTCTYIIITRAKYWCMEKFVHI